MFLFVGYQWPTDLSRKKKNT
jgi:hypothetical protein